MGGLPLKIRNASLANIAPKNLVKRRRVSALTLASRRGGFWDLTANLSAKFGKVNALYRSQSFLSKSRLVITE